MKKFTQSSKILLGAFFVFSTMGTMTAFAATDPGLGASGTFSIVAQTSITGTGAISGDVGLNSTGAGITALTAGDVGGTIYSTDGVAPGLAILAPAVQANLSTANGDISGQGSDGLIGPVLDGEVLTTGVYDIGAGRLNGGVLTLDGPGIYILRASSDLISSGSVNLINGARACDVYWQVNTLATINGSSFVGTIIAGTGVHFGANVALDGRALALGGDVTLLNTTISGPSCAASGTLNVIKLVTNDDDGTAVAADFDLHVTDIGGEVAGSPAVGTGAPGTAYSLAAGDYNVNEDAVVGYNATFSGDCDANGDITLAPGDNLTCTVTNNDIAPASINVVKTVINDNGRTNVIADFPLFVNAAAVLSGITNFFAPGAYTVTETGNSNYTQTFSGDCDANGLVNIIPGDNMFCIITNNDIASSGGGGNQTPLVVPPLINVVKVPNPLALPAGPGPVTYTYTLTNIGTVPVTNITMVGDTCSPINLFSGDTDADAKLDVSETWVYRCSTTLSETHTNNVVATGWANGLSIADIASATVVVGVPVVPPLIHVTKLPDRLTLAAGGGMITYTEKISNPGTVALSNVTLIDDKCSPMNYLSGDTNADSKLDTTETWTYTCRTNLSETTTNTAIASGEANGITVRDLAIATVLVSGPSSSGPVPSFPNTGPVPGFPNTGFAPEGEICYEIFSS